MRTPTLGTRMNRETQTSAGLVSQLAEGLLVLWRWCTGKRAAARRPIGGRLWRPLRRLGPNGRWRSMLASRQTEKSKTLCVRTSRPLFSEPTRTHTHTHKLVHLCISPHSRAAVAFLGKNNSLELLKKREKNVILLVLFGRV